jgi:hypothetical protein
VLDARDPKTPTLAIIIGSIGMSPSGKRLITAGNAWTLTVALYEPSVLARDMKTRSRSMLYGCERMISTGDKPSQSVIQKHTLDLLDVVIAEWKKANVR